MNEPPMRPQLPTRTRRARAAVLCGLLVLGCTPSQARRADRVRRASVAPSGTESAPRATTGAPELLTFLVCYAPGPAWAAGSAAHAAVMREHAAYLYAQFERGALAEAGPFGDGAGGAAVLQVASEAEARAIVERDPAVVQRVMVAEVRAWQRRDWRQVGAALAPR